MQKIRGLLLPSLKEANIEIIGIELVFYFLTINFLITQ